MADLTWAEAIGAMGVLSMTGFASAWAEKEIGSAAIGAMAENPDLFGKGLIFTALPETIVIFGLVVALKLTQLF